MSSQQKLQRKSTRFFTTLTAACLTGIITVCDAQTSPNCLLLGPAFPIPGNVLHRSSAVPDAAAILSQTIDGLLQDGTLDANNVSFYISAFSTNESVFNYSHAAPGLNGSLTAGVLDENTVFRIGSVSKLLTVYTLLSEVGMAHMNDPVTKWVPELAKVSGGGNPVNNVQWDEVTIGALASQMAGLSRDCERT